MNTIKMYHSELMGQLKIAEQALHHVELPHFPSDQLGKNQLSFTEKWLEREDFLVKMIAEYLEIVDKNLEDTRANIDLIKKQDEAIVK
ncbi:YwqI/YxiC family protein [Bacillaceae bacterium Marseille-Q3522]|nr:YwqI/YxiC family protein [Bacillaceae bacterium Marseille-Q3522]